MAEHSQYRLKIDVFSVDSIPMSRLAEYMAELAVLLGERERVHFLRLEAGSAVLVTSIEPVAFPKVEERVSLVGQGSGPKDAMQAFKNIDNMLAKDGAVAVLIAPGEGTVIQFPGRTRPKPLRYGPFREIGTLDGRIIRIGGRDETIPVWLKDGDVEHHCNVRAKTSRGDWRPTTSTALCVCMAVANGCVRKMAVGRSSSSTLRTSRFLTIAR